MRILVTRPREDGEDIAVLLAAMGHQCVLAPLLTPHYHDGPEPDLAGVQAILATSANGIRALVHRTARRDMPIFAVGPQTAQEARAAGFITVRNANGDSIALAQATAEWTTPAKGALLHVCGEDAPGTLADTLIRRGFSVRRAALYRIDAAAALPPDAVQALTDGTLDAALFFSARSAQVFGALAESFSTADLIAVCISQATADGLAPGAFKTVRIADAPNQAALLALVE